MALFNEQKALYGQGIKGQEHYMNIFDEIDGLEKLTPEQMEIMNRFKDHMDEFVIPKIVDTVFQRQQDAAKSRLFFIKTL